MVTKLEMPAGLEPVSASSEGLMNVAKNVITVAVFIAVLALGSTVYRRGSKTVSGEEQSLPFDL
jgi:hypothetical protein